MSLVFLGWTLWCLGYPAQARARIHEAVTLAHELSHPFSSAIALALGTPVAQFCRAVHGTQTQAETAIALCAEQEFAFYLMMGIIERGWALAKQGQAEEGMIQIRQGLVDYQATGAAWGLPYFLSLQAETYGNAGHTAAGLRTLAKALEVVEQTEERFIEAELYRLKGELLLATAPEHATEAETCFVHALDVARQQHGRSWELRTATSLARLWQSQAKFQDAYDLLAPIYGWFTEGFDTADLQEAKYLLDKLSEEVRTPTA
jgi:predicted ATPase